MPHTEHLCSHLNEVTDEIRGEIICTDCGLVLSKQLFMSYSIPQNEFASHANEKSNEIDELLEKLNLPRCFSNTIFKKYNAVTKRKRKELLPYTVYKTLNKEGFPISIKEMSAVSGFTDSKLYRMQDDKAIILDPPMLLEKYCKILGLDYHTYTVIKTGLPNTILTGHNPLTIIASTIYSYLKQYKTNQFSMKKIAQTVNTSCISIQRFLKKHELSFRL